MKEYHRNATIFAGVFTTIQGVFWAFVAVYSIGVYGCTFAFPFYNDKHTTVGNLLFFSYFVGDCHYSNSGQVPPSLLNFEHPHKTYILMIIYGILSAVWIPSSILVLVISVNKIHGKRASRCYWPWIITTGAILLLDIAASIIYIIDITRSMTVNDYAEQFHYPYRADLKDMDGLTVVPAVIMTIFSCRGLIIYIINAVIFGVVIQASIALKRLSPAAAFVEEICTVPKTVLTTKRVVRRDLNKASPPSATFKSTVIKSDARMAPTNGYSGQSSSWVRLNRRPGGLPEVSPPMKAEEANMPRIQERPQFTFQSSEKKPERPNRLQLEESRRPARPALKPLPISSPSVPPPPPPDINSPAPLYDVFGQPTTPDSPQPAFVRTRSPLTDGANSTPSFSRHPRSSMPHQQPPPKSIPEPDYTIHPKRTRHTNIITSPQESDSSSLPRRPGGINKNMPWSYMGPQQQPSKLIPEPDYTIRQKRSSPTTNSAPSDELEVFTNSKRFENNPNVWKVM